MTVSNPFIQSVKRAFAPCLVIVLFLAVWETYSRTSSISGTVLPPFSRVMQAGWTDRQSLMVNTLPTVREVLVGFAISLLFAFAISIVLDVAPRVNQAVMPLLIGSQTIPLVVLAPLFVIWFGYTVYPKILVAVLQRYLIAHPGRAHVFRFSVGSPPIGHARLFHGSTHWNHLRCRCGDIC